MSAENKKSRKEMLREFREQKETGGVYALRNRQSGKMLILSTAIIAKAQNQLDFAKATGSCVQPPLAEDWAAIGPDGFELVILETLDRNSTQTSAEFSEDIKALEALWREKYKTTELY